MASADQLYLDSLQSGAEPVVALNDYLYGSQTGRVTQGNRLPADTRDPNTYSGYGGTDPSRANRNAPQTIMPLAGQIGSFITGPLAVNVVMLIIGTSFVLMGGWFAFKNSEAAATKPFK